MTPDDVYELRVEAVSRMIDTDERAATLLRRESRRLGMQLNDFLWPTEARRLIDERRSPVLDAVLGYFSDKGD